MEELASIPVRTVRSRVELVAELGLVVGGKVCFLMKFIFPMCERAAIIKFAFAKQLPIPAHLSLELHLILLYKVITLLFGVEVTLGSLHSGSLK
jgi:hypothetical protein